MHRLVLSAMLFALTSPCLHAEQFNKSYNLSGTPQIHVETDDASIRVRSCDCKQVQVNVDIQGYKPDHVHVSETQSGDQINFEVRTRNQNEFFHLGSSHRWIHVDLTVPQQSNLQLHSGDGQIEAENIQGDIRLTTSDGRI